MPSYSQFTPMRQNVHPERPTDLYDRDIYKNFLDLFGIGYFDGNQRFYDIVRDRVLIVPMNLEKPPIVYERDSANYANEMNEGIKRILHKIPPEHQSFTKAIEYIRNGERRF